MSLDGHELLLLDPVDWKVGGTGETTIRAFYEEAPGAQLIADTGSITIDQLCP